MEDRILQSLVKLRSSRTANFENLMSWRVRNILLVSSQYDFFTFQEDGRLAESIFGEFLELNLSYATNIRHASTAAQALEMLRASPFDLVISMIKLGDTNIDEFCRSVRELNDEIPLALLASSSRDLAATKLSKHLEGTDRVFIWSGDVRLFLAIIKSVEDRVNAWHDTSTMGVPNLLIVEDNVKFYSSYLPILYTQLMEHCQALMSDGLNRMQKIFRMRARPKVLLATTFEEGISLYERYQEHMIGVMVDAAFPRGGVIDPKAGIKFAKIVRERTPDRPILMQSSDEENAEPIRKIGGHFINKRSPTLLHDVRSFLRNHLGFADFQFQMPDGTNVGSASDIRTLQEQIAVVPIESIVHHGGRNDFSTWLMNRTELDLSRELRPRCVTDFDDPEDMRIHLISVLESHRAIYRAGVVAEFSGTTFEGTSGFVRIGTGSLGGKGRGLAFFHTLLEKYEINERFSDINIFIPPTAVVATEIFDQFMSSNDLTDFALGEATDEEIYSRFLEADLPKEAIEALSTFLMRIDYPLAVRSSSLLEDGSHQPFAGVYQTYMIPNNHPDFQVRLKNLCDAVKLVYASTYYAAAESYVSATQNRLEEEKMAVVIQEVVGRRHGDHVYPMIAGVARSNNYYPMEGTKSEDGVASVVLGLGKMVVEGERCVRFCPKYPRKLYQFSSPGDTLRTAQSEFLALNMAGKAIDLPATAQEDPFITRLGLDQAEKDGTLGMVGSVYDAESLAIRDGISRSGPRLVSMAGILKNDSFELAGALDHLLKIGSATFSGPVEIEFAADYRETHKDPHQLGFLQIRPVVIDSSDAGMDLEHVKPKDAICICKDALGHGYVEGVRDIVYVPMGTFDRSKTVEIALEIAKFNGRLVAQERPFVLMGPGRWGSADRWLGIPVKWIQISGAACIIETDMQDIKVAPSQGTHFFQNMTSLGITYFTVDSGNAGNHLDMDWLDAAQAISSNGLVRHVRFDEPLEIAVNSRQRMGVLMKPGKRIADPAG